MQKTIRKYIALDYLYFGIPFLLCILYLGLVINWQSLQKLVNSVYANFFNLLMVALAVIAVPNFARLVYYSKRVADLPSDIRIPSTMSERFGGAGEGKTSSAILQACFEAEKLEDEIRSEYNFLQANYERFKKKAPWRLKNFERIKKSVEFWDAHSELIPFLGSNVEIRLPNGQKSLFVTRNHLEQKEWLPILFFIIDEAGTTLPQDEWQDRPAAVVLTARFGRHFGFKGTFCEQKKDGILINVRAVLGGTILSLGQRNALQPDLLIGIISFLKWLLPKFHNSKTLGLLIDKLQQFASCLGFRLWDQLYFKTMEFTQYKPPESLTIVCTNKMPCSYDDTCFSELYLAKDKEAKAVVLEGDHITPESELGQQYLLTLTRQEEQRSKKAQEERVKQKELIAKELKADSNIKKYQDTDTK